MAKWSQSHCCTNTVTRFPLTLFLYLSLLHPIMFSFHAFSSSRPSLFTLPQYMCHFLFLLHGLDTPTHSPFPYFFLFYKEMRIVRCSSHENSNFTAWVFRNTVRKSTTMTTPLYFLGHLTLDCIINGPYTKKKKKKVFLDILNCKMRGLGTSHIQLRGKPFLLEIVFMRSFPTMNQVILLPKRTLDRSLDAIWTLCL